MSFTVVIPSRYASSRLPGKPLADIGGKPMVQWVYEQALQAGAEDVIVATDDERVADTVSSFGGKVCMTSPNHESGTERLAEVVEKMADTEPIDEDQYQTMPLDKLVAHIQDRHHVYVRENIPVLLGYLHKINKVHGDRHPELNELYVQFESCAFELTHHMFKEETILFPAIMQLVEASETQAGVAKPFFFGTLSNPISMMKDEHSTEGDRFHRMAEITDNYTPPADGCTTYRVAFSKLKDFQDDLFLHIHLENNIVFPRALALERGDS